MNGITTTLEMKINMLYKNLAITFVIFILLGCTEKNQSIPVTLYRDRVESGNSITSFINWNDPDGTIAMKYCEDFRKLYEIETGSKFVCAPIAYKEFAPKIRWNLSN